MKISIFCLPKNILRASIPVNINTSVTSAGKTLSA